MSEKLYMDADYEVIRMVNNKRGPGGELPSKVVHFIPEENAAQVLAIDRRIQKIREHKALIIAGAILLAFLIGVRV